MSDLIQQANAIWSILAGIFGMLSGVLLTVWRASRYVALNDERVGKLTAGFEAIAAGLSAYSKEFAALRAIIQEREKDLLRLEGVSDAARRDMLETIKSLERVTAKIDAMWLTLQRLHPEHVPKRASDRS